MNSARQEGPFVTVDCTTLPGQLVESELFGHERGAFSDARERKLGLVAPFLSSVCNSCTVRSAAWPSFMWNVLSPS